MKDTPLRLALTPGEPAGIGPDLCLQIAAQPLPVELVIITDLSLLEDRARQLGLTVRLNAYDANRPPAPHCPGTLTVLPLPLEKTVHCGRPDPANAAHVLATLQRAVDGCLHGEFAALVTGPINKAVINQAGIPFSGHTEYLAQLVGKQGDIPQVVMMLATHGLRVALVTTHLPLTEVSRQITPTHLTNVLRIVHHDLQQYFHIEHPRMLVLGLNPHAGEQGHLGREEIEVIEPVLESLRREGMTLTGPVPADTAFIPSLLENHDVVVAMYHDQGLPVLKHIGFGQAVNITLGLPFVRTSVDHGTALELAGTGQADTGSLQTAIDTAMDMLHT